MMRLRISQLLFRRIHKWVGLVLGIQFILWALSGSMMALLDADAVGGHDGPAMHVMAVATDGLIDPARAAGQTAVSGLVLRDLAGTPVYELTTGSGVRLVDARTGAPVRIDNALATQIAGHVANAPALRATLLERPNLEAREHVAPMWRIDFKDAENSSVYVSATTGRHLVTRGDTWRTWDFFWMLHNMDYFSRTSFNHPLIILVAFGVLWLSGTGFYLLFKSFRKSDFRWLRRRKPVA
ncbi:PepSY domain-containing protein [Sphingomonas kyeonggiensis]